MVFRRAYSKQRRWLQDGVCKVIVRHLLLAHARPQRTDVTYSMSSAEKREAIQKLSPHLIFFFGDVFILWPLRVLPRDRSMYSPWFLSVRFNRVDFGCGMA